MTLGSYRTVKSFGVNRNTVFNMLTFTAHDFLGG